MGQEPAKITYSEYIVKMEPMYKNGVANNKTMYNNRVAWLFVVAFKKLGCLSSAAVVAIASSKTHPFR